MRRDIARTEVEGWAAANVPDPIVRERVLECVGHQARNWLSPKLLIRSLQGITAYRLRYVKRGQDTERQQAIADAAFELIYWLRTMPKHAEQYGWDHLFDGQPHDVELWRDDPADRPLDRPVFWCEWGSVRGVVAAAARRRGVTATVNERLEGGRVFFSVQKVADGR